MASMLSVSLLAGCGKEASDREDDDVRTERNVEDNENKENGTVTASIDTKNFDKMMDAYKDYYNEFCDENLKPYYEDHSDCDCAARFVVNPDDNKVMMVIADIVDCAGNEIKVDLYFFEYSGGKVKEYLSIPSIWTTTDGIYVGNIVDELYVSTTTYPNGGQYEHTQYRIADGKAEEITQSKEDDEEWIDIETSNGVFEYALPYNLSERIFTDCDSDANKYCVSERDFEDCIDYLKENVPESVASLKVIYGDFLVENRITSYPNTNLIYEDVCYYYVRNEKIEDALRKFGYDYDKNLINGYEPDMRGYLFPCVKDLLESEYPASIDEYDVYPFEEKEIIPLLQIIHDEGIDSILDSTKCGYKIGHFGEIYWNGESPNYAIAEDAGVGTSEGGETATADAGSATTSSSSADDEILQKYQDYIDANYSYNIIDNGGCVFYDIDGDGTPELLCNITAQFQTILYEDCNGDISEINGVQWSGAGDGRIIQRSEAGGIYFNYLSEGIVVDTVYIEVELEPTDNDPYAGRYYYSYGDIYDEISESEYQSYLDEIEADNMLIPTWSLYNDVCHGSDIQGAWDLYQKYN